MTKTDETNNRYYTDYKEFILESAYRLRTGVNYRSSITDIALTSALSLKPTDRHDIKAGLNISLKHLSPTIDVFRNEYSMELNVHGKYDTMDTLTTNRIGSKMKLVTTSVYAEDDIEWNSWLKSNIGIRASYYGVKGKSYLAVEPRLSLRLLLNDNIALKLGYAHMTQGVHQLASGNLTTPSDIWIPITKDIGLSTSDQISISYNHDVTKDISLSVEAYYKTMDNLLEYKDGASFLRGDGAWEDMIAIGKGKAYGVEFLLQKKFGVTNGWISYTWSRSLRKFDRLGMEVSGGKEFRATTDRPLNFNIVISHQLGKHWDLNLSWTYQSGRRGTLTNISIYSGQLDQYQAWSRLQDTTWEGVHNTESIYFVPYGFSGYESAYAPTDAGYAYLRKFVPANTFYERNGYKLPDTHHLDIGINYHIDHKWGESVCNLSVYNVYNRQNISNV